ncbi:hypothetical protein Tco_0607994 [Tanacetum coccineum]
MIVGIEESRHGPSDIMHNPSQPLEFLSKEILSHLSRRYTRYLLTFHSEIVDIEKLTVRSLLDSLLTRLVLEAPLWEKKMARIEEIKNDARLIETDDQLLVLIKRQVKTELMLEEKFRDLCEEVSNFVKEIEDVVKEVEWLSCKDVAKEIVRLFRHGQKHLELQVS